MACKSNITGDFLIWVVALTDAVTGAVLVGISASRVFPSTSQHPDDSCQVVKEILIANDLQGGCLSLDALLA
jgi:hypothetical protein